MKIESLPPVGNGTKVKTVRIMENIYTPFQFDM